MSILDLSKIEAGKLELEIVETDVVALVEQTADILKYQVVQKGLELLLDIDPATPRLAYVDPIRLRQILINLTNNAVKFTDHGQVEIHVAFAPIDQERGRYTFSVRDTGIGISSEQQRRLFVAFSQADTATTRKFGGTGLGLVISNLLAEKMGSHIKVESTLGSGSTFSFCIEAAYTANQDPPPRTTFQVRRILVVDDNDANRLILERNCTHWGIDCIGCDNGLSALKILTKQGPFDALIVDYHMPFVNGFDTIRMIRKEMPMEPEQMPIILLHRSAEDPAIRQQCQQLGIFSTLVKPVKASELYNLLQTIRPDMPGIVAELTPPPVQIEECIPKQTTILVAEDMGVNMLLVKILLSRLQPNARIIQAVNGQEAVKAAHEHAPDLILMDVHMPILDGLDATRQIRAQENGNQRRVPIIALTAGALHEEQQRCLASGMDDFLAKPIQVHALTAMLTQYLGERNDPLQRPQQGDHNGCGDPHEQVKG